MAVVKGAAADGCHKELKNGMVGKKLQDINGPAAIIDVAVVRRNCKEMLQTAEKLHVGFRAHVKSHKTVELTRLQVGEDSTSVNIIVSTIAEAEHLLPFLIESVQQQKEVNVLYGIPPSSSSFGRLKHLSAVLGTNAFTFLIDHPEQLQYLVEDKNLDTNQIPIFVKINSGYHRAGVTADSSELKTLLEAVLHSERTSRKPNVRLVGFYSHFGTSYNANSPLEGLQYLAEEIEQTHKAARLATAIGFANTRFILSIGATPTASSARSLLFESGAGTRVKELLTHVQRNHDVELHAGVYPLRDMQQLATYSDQQDNGQMPLMSAADIGIRVLAEVLSLYHDREKPEALIGAGTLAMGREPCKSYPGWGIVAPSPWSKHLTDEKTYDEKTRTGWILGRISQEHGMLTWEGPTDHFRKLNIGDKVLLWPNHACVTGAGYDSYLIVDSDGAGKGDEVVDLWVRCRGW